MKRKIVALLAALLCGALCLGLAACGKEGPAEGPQAVAEAIFHAPNEELFSLDAASSIGLGVEQKPEEQKKAEEANQQMMANWESSLGKYFAPNCLKPAIASDGILQFLAQCAMNGQKSTVNSVELSEEGELYQNLMVHYTLDGEEKEALVKFSLDKDGLITRVIID